MLVLQAAKSPPNKSRGKVGRPARIGLAVAGGGPLGGMYESGGRHGLRLRKEVLEDDARTLLGGSA